eukprot:1941778-Pyramimonas_sp.AAC.1
MVTVQRKDCSWPEFDMRRRRQGRKSYHAAGFPSLVQLFVQKQWGWAKDSALNLHSIWQGGGGGGPTART